MTPEEQRIAIAKACGPSKFVGLKKRGLWYRPNAKGYTAIESEAGRYTREEAKLHEYPYDEPVTIHEFSTPDYLNDLNAMHDAEKVLTGERRGEMIDALCVIVRRDHNVKDGPMTAIIEAFYATAKQRAEAFLRTLNLWKD